MNAHRLFAALAVFAAAQTVCAGRATAPQVFAKFQEIATDTLWPGYQPATFPLAIYDGEQTWLFRHPAPPEPFKPAPGAPDACVMPGRHELVVANSSAELGGVTIGTVMMANMADSPVERIAAVAVHECFHAFERIHHPTWAGNEALLFVYPLEDATGFALRRLEERSLRDALEFADDSAAAEAAATFVQLRKERFEELGADLAGYERNSELNEGLATYVQYRSITADPLEKLPAEGYPLANIRDRVYGTGLALAYLLDRFDPDWKQATKTDAFRSLDEHLAAALQRRAAQPRAMSADERSTALAAAEKVVAELRTELARERSALLDAPGHRLVIRAAAPADALMLQGFDPLNVLRLGDTEVLHTRYLALGAGGNTFEMEGFRALSTGVGPHPLFNGVRELVLTGIAETPRVERSGDATRVTAPHIKLSVANGTVSTTGNQTTVLLGKTE